ncbi:MAG: DUF2461 domain-containing protein [Muribaculaceae bacterium]|nr:DUF2461 domain-containing protein [Muribaculaceae bacterium]MDE6574892.1 DUF2461 domain-containing protein [Muribaculaceae bacterium]
MQQVYDFLRDLAENNNREWFNANKSRYEAVRKYWLSQIQILINEMAAYEPSFRNLAAADCAYRIYRDTRFSHDKTPYKTHFSALLSPTGRHCDRACYYFHTGVDESAVYSGLWCPEPKVLKKVRKAIIDNVEEFRAIVETPEVLAEFPQWWGRQLKTAPKGYDRNHPDIDLLRLTEYGRCHNYSPDFFNEPGWQHKTAETLKLLKPMNDFLNYSIDE